MEKSNDPKSFVFGLDIGTRSLVGTVGYMEGSNRFKVVAQQVQLHETRAMMDGQIHDIPRVAESIAMVKNELERQTGTELTDVCIAAAGRVLITMNVEAEYSFPSETVITDEHIHSLDLMGVEKAYEQIRAEKQDEDMVFYCVGYSVVKYYMNDYPISNLEGHKANKISTELLATFLPEDVIDGLYSSVERAGLRVANLTLEPIAAINVAIPEKFRLLNIALVDVGAGTSDICITKDGSVIAYGMIPYAGDEITELLVQQYLVDFNMAEKIKINSSKSDKVIYEDIMGLEKEIPSSEVLDICMPTVTKIAKDIAGKIIELNGGKAVSAAFIVGGGGKIPGFVTAVAEELGIPYERVALRGEEVLGQVDFLQPDIKKDPLLVTPIGICLNYYDRKNNFIFVLVNGERVKLYDNNKLTIMDATFQVGYPNDRLFPKRGKEINYTLDGKPKMARGDLGEPAVICLNGKAASINTPIVQNDVVEITDSIAGEDAALSVGKLSEYREGTIDLIFNDRKVQCPHFVEANGKLVSEFYEIKDQDELRLLNYYTLEQVLEFMDLPYHKGTLVNREKADRTTLLYSNFTVFYPEQEIEESKLSEYIGNSEDDYGESLSEEEAEAFLNRAVIEEEVKPERPLRKMEVTVNETPLTLSGKSDYILVDVLDFYEFDLSVAKGANLITLVNEIPADFSGHLRDHDQVRIFWSEV